MRLFYIVMISGILLLLLVTLINSQHLYFLSEDQVPVSWNKISVIHEDGTCEIYDSNSFPQTGLNDTVIGEIELPDNPGDGNYSLFTNFYNNVITVRYKDTLLFTYGEDQARTGQQIGNVFVCADIPEAAWGDRLTVELKFCDYSFAEALTPAEIHRSSNKNSYLLKGSAVPYLISVMFFSGCLMVMVLLLVIRSDSRVRSRGLILVTLGISTMLWSMGYQRMFFVTSDNSPLICNLEYIGIFATPAAFCMFMTDTEKGTHFRKMMKVMLYISTASFGVCTFLNYFTRQFHYCRTLPLIHLFLIVFIIMLTVHFIKVKCPDDIYIKSFRTGTVVFGFFAIVDLVIYYLNHRGVQSTSVSFVQFGLFAYLMILGMSYINYLFNTLKDKERLKKLAYTDGMTGVSNRRACLEYLEKLNKSDIPYAVVFIDVNNLKLANDKYSHDVGDRLIVFMASSIKEAFGDECFCGRYGGDEFIAGMISKSDLSKEISEKISNFRELVKKENRKKDFPFEVSAACGFALSTENPDKSADEILGIADQNMYENKKTMKMKKQ